MACITAAKKSVKVGKVDVNQATMVPQYKDKKNFIPTKYIYPVAFPLQSFQGFLYLAVGIPFPQSKTNQAGITYARVLVFYSTVFA
jgi:hypothetical protein